MLNSAWSGRAVLLSSSLRPSTERCPMLVMARRVKVMPRRALSCFFRSVLTSPSCEDNTSTAGCIISSNIAELMSVGVSVGATDVDATVLAGVTVGVVVGVEEGWSVGVNVGDTVGSSVGA